MVVYNNLVETVIDKSLARQLLHMSEADQAMRARVTQYKNAWDFSIDEQNTTRLKEIVEEQGWPMISRVGAVASRAAWLLIQHSPDLNFMKRCLKIMKALPADEISPLDLAYLEDRVLMMSGELQVYGTQFKGKGKKFHVYPIKDHDNVDDRRARVGLCSFAEDEVKCRKMYGGY